MALEQLAGTTAASIKQTAYQVKGVKCNATLTEENVEKTVVHAAQHLEHLERLTAQAASSNSVR